MTLHFSDRLKKVVKEIGTGIFLINVNSFPPRSEFKTGPDILNFIDEINMNTFNELPRSKLREIRPVYD
jgi:hypothetical protein